MERLYQPLLLLLARCCRNEIIRQVEWLKAENDMLRKRGGSSGSSSIRRSSSG